MLLQNRLATVLKSPHVLIVDSAEIHQQFRSNSPYRQQKCDLPTLWVPLQKNIAVQKRSDLVRGPNNLIIEKPEVKKLQVARYGARDLWIAPLIVLLQTNKIPRSRTKACSSV